MALTTWPAYKASAYQAEQVNKHMWLAKGIGTDELYVVEVDPVSGGFPITFAGAQGFGDPAVGLRTASIPGNASGIADFDAGPIGAQTPRVAAALIQPTGDPYDTNAGAAGTDTLRVVLATGGAGISFSADDDWGPVGPNTLRTASILGNEGGLADFGAGNYSGQTLRAVIASDQPAIPVSQSGAPWSVDITNLPAALATDVGPSDADTLRTASNIYNDGNPLDYGAGTGGSNTLRAVIDTRSEASTTPLAVRPSNGTSFADFGVGTSGTTTPRIAANLYNNGSALDYGVGTGGSNTLRAAIDTRSEAAATPLAARLTNGTNFLATDTGAAGADVLRTVISSRSEAAVTPLATRASNGTSFSDYGAGATSSATPRATANITRNGTELSYNVGAADANTLRVALANESKAQYGRTPVDALLYTYASLGTSYTSALTLDSGGTTLASDVNYIDVFDDSGGFLFLTWGGGSPDVTNTVRISPGGNGPIPCRIPAGSDIRIKWANVGSQPSGNIQIDFLN